MRSPLKICSDNIAKILRIPLNHERIMSEKKTYFIRPDQFNSCPIYFGSIEQIFSTLQHCKECQFYLRSWPNRIFQNIKLKDIFVILLANLLTKNSHNKKAPFSVPTICTRVHLSRDYNFIWNFGYWTVHFYPSFKLTRKALKKTGKPGKL